MFQSLLIRKYKKPSIGGDDVPSKVYGVIDVPADTKVVEWGGSLFVDTGRVVRIFEQTEKYTTHQSVED